MINFPFTMETNNGNQYNRLTMNEDMMGEDHDMLSGVSSCAMTPLMSSKDKTRNVND